MNDRFLVCIMVIIGSVGCTPYEISTPESMVSVEKDDRRFVAMTSDGVVLRALVHEQGDGEVGAAGLDFWADSIRERMRTRGGYALLEDREVKSANGVVGSQFEFGRDQDGGSYHYLLTLFVTEANIHLIDAGGLKERVENARPAINKALSTYSVKR